MYTDEAMISVLQKIDAAFSAGDISDVKISLNGKDEGDCFNVARVEKYIEVGANERVFIFHTAGRIALDRLLKAKAEKSRENFRSILNVIAVSATSISAIFIAATFWAMISNKTTVLEQPIRVECTIEILPGVHPINNLFNRRRSTARTGLQLNFSLPYKYSHFDHILNISDPVRISLSNVRF